MIFMDGLVLAFMAVAAVADTGVDDSGFDIESRLALVNLSGVEGRDYDRQLGEFFQHRPEVEKDLTACVTDYPGAGKLIGYFRFSADGGYRVMLRPSGAFADCAADAFSGYRPPPPPQLPYFNPFEFGIAE